MFPIIRYGLEQKGDKNINSINIDNVDNSINREQVLLSKINERLAGKRKQRQPAEKVSVEVKLKKQKTERKYEERTTVSIESKRHASSSSAIEGLNENILEAFPRFEIPKKTAAEMAISKRLGITDWIAHPITIDPDKTVPVDKKDNEGDERFGLSKELIARCKALGITEFFAVQLAVIPILLSSRSLLNTHHLSPPGDICVSAPTGSGKTLAYVLPIIEILSKRIVTRLRALVVLPTRDLVTQVKETFEAFCKGTDLKVGVITGQASFASEQAQIIGNNENNLRLLGGLSKIDILIATPGRLIDHLAITPHFTLQHLRYQDWLPHVLKAIQSCTQTQKIDNNNDDGAYYNKENNKNHKELQSQLIADYDLSSSDFLSKEIPIHDAVCSATSVLGLPPTDISDIQEPFVQKLLFSATLTRNPAKIASLQLTNPRYIAVQLPTDDQKQGQLQTEIKYTIPSSLKEYMIITSSSEKPLVVLHLLHNYHVSAVLCFTKSVESAHRLSKLIQFFEASFSNDTGRSSNNDDKDIDEKQIVATEYSSDLSKKERIKILNKFKAGKIHILICSDLIARGIDLDCVDTVINYDVPLFMKKYVHRVGRTARAGRAGEAYSLVETQEARHFKEMLKKANHLDKVKKINIKHELLAPMEQAYQNSLTSLKDYMTRGKSSVINYQKSYDE
ncbi:9427_t:CDS:10 [Ambispora leptoticha]|uniref:ATP-dependent RNA helicase n=1 Tax=Ambispora leptoticha TaxID=144679 RepID=A0A9N8ZNQ1_9GLOM|nr:9427_t:CDS:10 [Ambispora leptoticha]